MIQLIIFNTVPNCNYSWWGNLLETAEYSNILQISPVLNYLNKNFS